MEANSANNICPSTPVADGFDAVILCDGDFPSHTNALTVLRNAKYLCCCDGAGMRCMEDHGITPDAIVGDGDSLPTEFKQRHKDILHMISEQEFNDMTKATRFCMSRGAKRIAYLGATGKREDHSMGNIALLAYYLDTLHIDATMFTDHGLFTPVSGSHVFRSFARQQVSIFNISCSKLTSDGLRWQCFPYKQLWQGTLNEAEGDSFTLHGDGTYIVFQTYETKK